MGWRNFWSKTWSVIVIIFNTIWFVNVLIFFLVPRILFGSFQRQHIKNKIKRNLKKTGVPSKQANQYAKIYQKMLFQYSSIRGLYRFAKNTKGLSDLAKSQKESDDSLSNIDIMQPYKISFS
ncbi:MAG: hypothetical protein ACFFDW_07655 [Candidatus Thorarchaeota archaeon]